MSTQATVIGVAIAILLMFLVACGVLGFDGPKSAQDDSVKYELTTTGQSFKLEFGCLHIGLESCIAAQEFAKRVQDYTGGQVEINVVMFPEDTLLKKLRDGDFAIVELYSAMGEDLAFLDIDDLWGLYDDYETQAKITEATREDIENMVLDKLGSVVLGYQFYPSYYFFAKQPLRTAADFEGLRTRSNNIVLRDLLDGMGAESVDVPFTEVYAGLETDTIEAAVSCGTCGSGLRWYEVSDYLVGPVVALPHSWIAINQHVWADIPPDLQTVIREEVKRHEELTKRNALTIWDGVEENERSGMTHIELSPDLRRLAREAAMSTVLPNWIERVGGQDSEAARIYAGKVAPILNVPATSEGNTSEIR